MDGKESVRLGNTGTATGWAAIAKTMRNVDEDKVKDCKEDIDTLLVFTGLFSAVLTAFVLESYQALSPDKMDTVIALLGQIASHSDTNTGISSIVNSTIPTFQQATISFEPPLSALRANQLWFASLLITLVIASFAMLVKQWLREYLAMDYTSPHERLRARQFRHRGLSTWKVYEIAGILPLLLQLALGLFFLGLCFFTFSVNVQIGGMSITLVAGWAFFFAVATFSPAYSPQCPYKTAALKYVMIFLRRHLNQLLYPKSVQRGLNTISHTTTLGVIPDGGSHSHAALECSFMEETAAIKLDTDELTILKEVDAFLLDDDLLGTTILDSLMQSRMDPSTIITFVLQAVNLRINGIELRQPLTSAPDLRRLTSRGWVAVSNIVASTMLNNFSKHEAVIGCWLEDAVFLLLATSNHPLTPSACNALMRCVQRTTIHHLMNVLHLLATSPNTFSRIYAILDPLTAHLRLLLEYREIQPSDIVSLVLKLHALEMRRAEPPTPLRSILDLRSLSQPLWRFSSDALAGAIGYALEPGRRQNRPEAWLEDAIYILLSVSPYPLTPPGVDALAFLCTERAPYYKRFSDCFRKLASPGSSHFIHILSRIHKVCLRITDDASVVWLLREIVYSTSCTSQCIHPASHHSLSFALLLAEHSPRHGPTWTRHFVSILVERAQRIPVAESAWPPGATESLYALLSLSASDRSTHPEVSGITFAIISSEQTALSALLPLISVRPEDRSRIRADRAISYIAELVSAADTKGRQQFLSTMQSICTTYTSAKAFNKHYAAYNIVRHVMLVVTILSCIQPDDKAFKDFILFCEKCAETMAVSRATDYPTLTDKEKAYTREAADKCLELLENIDSIAGAPLDGSPETYALPDVIFQELAEFIADESSLRYKRVRYLRKLEPEEVEITNGGRLSGDEHDEDETISGLTSVVP